MTLAERVRRAMAHRGCDAAELAKAAGIKAPSVHGWLNGSSKSMMASPCIRAATYMGVNPLWLAEGTGQMQSGAARVMLESQRTTEPLRSDERELLEGYRAAGPERKEDMLNAARRALRMRSKGGKMQKANGR